MKPLALNAYLAILDDPQVVCGVKQKTPTDLDSGVTATMELESYLVPVRASTTAVITVSSTNEKPPTEVTEAVAAAVTSTTERLASFVGKLTDCVKQLEATRARPPAAGSWGRQSNTFPREGLAEIICFQCGMKGHITRNQGNWIPSTEGADCGGRNYLAHHFPHNTLSFTVSPTHGYHLEGTINSVPTKFLLATGAAVTLLQRDTWAKTTVHCPQELEPHSFLKLTGVD